MADGSPIFAALGLTALGASHLWSFQVSDIVLTAATPTPSHKLMDAFHKLMEASSARASGTMK
jgi:hypothetical protein